MQSMRIASGCPLHPAECSARWNMGQFIQGCGHGMAWHWTAQDRAIHTRSLTHTDTPLASSDEHVQVRSSRGSWPFCGSRKTLPQRPEWWRRLATTECHTCPADASSGTWPHPFDSPNSRASIEPVLRRHSCFTPDIGSRSPRRSPPPAPSRHPGFHNPQRGTHSYNLIGPWGFSGVRGPSPNSICPVLIGSGPSGIGIFPGPRFGLEQQFAIFPSFLQVLDKRNAWNVAMNRGTMPWEAGSADCGVRVRLLSLRPGRETPAYYAYGCVHARRKAFYPHLRIGGGDSLALAWKTVPPLSVHPHGSHWAGDLHGRPVDAPASHPNTNTLGLARLASAVL